jgi:hypothetical protein
MDKGKLGEILHEIVGVVGLHHLHDVVDEAVKDEESAPLFGTSTVPASDEKEDDTNA